MAQKEPTVFRKVIVDCYSVGRATSELQPKRHDVQADDDLFCSRSLFICILSLVRIYFLTAFDIDVFCNWDKEKKITLLKEVVMILSSDTEAGRDILHSLKEDIDRLKIEKASADSDLQKAREKVHLALLRQDVHFVSRQLSSLWTSAGLPNIILFCNVYCVHENAIDALVKGLNILETIKPFKNHAFESSHGYSILLDNSQQMQALILSNERNIAEKARSDEELYPDESNSPLYDSRASVRIPFAITKDGAYFYTPKDIHGRKGPTLMQCLMANDTALAQPPANLTKEAMEKWSEVIRLFKQKRILGKQEITDSQAYDFLLVVSFAVTSEGAKKAEDYNHEIIDFALVIVDLNEAKEMDSFHSFCKPRRNSQLTQFCIDFTGVQQTDVEKAEEFLGVLSKLELWLKEKGVLERKCALATDSGSNMAQVLRLQCELAGVSIPKWSEKWVNLEVAFKGHYKIDKRQSLNPSEMIQIYRLKFDVDEPHLVRDTAKNLTRVALLLIDDGCRLLVNQCMTQKEHRRFRFVDKIEAEKLAKT